VDLFDLIPVSPHVPAPRPRSASENLSGLLGLVVLPCADFALVLFAGVWSGPVIALFVLPAAFALLTFALSRVLGTSVGWTLKVTLGCAIYSFIASGGAFMLALFTSLWAGF
jgi:hypothetical protein